MRQQDVTCKQAIIYEVSGDDLHLLQYLCREMGLREKNCDNKFQFEKECHSSKVDVAIINIQLPKVKLSPDIPVIAIGDETATTAINLVRYNPVLFVPKPFQRSSLRLGLAKALKIPMSFENYFARLVEVRSFLKEIEFHTTQLECSELMHMTLKESIDRFCLTDCSFVKTSQEIEKGIEDYEVLDVLNERGTLMCNRMESCQLRQFTKYLEAKSTQKLNRKAFDYLDMNIGGTSFLERTRELLKLYDQEIYQVYQHKKVFCCEMCEKIKKDLAHIPGDILHSTKDEMLKGKVFYCKESDCPLEIFFLVQGRKVL